LANTIQTGLQKPYLHDLRQTHYLP
jgi:hypothetical protein